MVSEVQDPVENLHRTSSRRNRDRRFGSRNRRFAAATNGTQFSGGLSQPNSAVGCEIGSTTFGERLVGSGSSKEEVRQQIDRIGDIHLADAIDIRYGPGRLSGGNYPKTGGTRDNGLSMS